VKKVTMSVQKTRLDNGLTVVLRAMHHAPVASFWIWYRVGSRNERSGITGVSHWVEHMMFRGSPLFPPGSLDRLVSREGGRWNAFTTHDFTAYFETMPSDRIELALQLEADRMVNASMSDEDVEAERTVIISERHMYENQPMFLLREELMAAAFRVHPYHHEIVGDETDLETMTRDDLYSHYRRFYNPANAVVVASGDFDSPTMLRRIEGYFGQIPAFEPAAPQIRPEPPLRGERRVTVNGPGDAAYLAYSFRVPEATHEDFYPLVLLDAAYAGGGGIGHFGGGTTNKSSRLYKALVNTDLAAAISGSVSPSIDPYLYTIFAVARPGVTLAEIESALAGELDRLGKEPLTQTELEKAIKRARASYVLAGESVTGQAQMIGMAEAVAGDYRWYENTLEALAAVTLDDIERVRQTYLRPGNRVVGLYQPEENGQH
jgi:zinc protease